MKFINEKKESVLKKLASSISIIGRDYEGWEEAFSYYNSDGLNITFSVGPVDRGSRIDHGGGEDGDDWLEDHEVDNLRDEYYKRNKSKLERLQKILKEEFSEYECSFPEPTIDYGEKGHVMLEVYVAIKGRFFTWNSQKIWADYSGTYEKEKIMLQTPDIERYFETEESIVEFLKTFKNE